ncbi:MAG TPA: MFS transporter [Anaerolineales bacterium]|jgi:MFS family permease|nr:MFS transporter [Anaerolineales bacterium]
MTETVKKQPLLSGLLILFLAAMILANVGNNMFDGLLPLYLKDLDASIPQIGLFFTLAQIAPLLLQILGGWISDSLGRLRAIAIGSVFGVIGFIPLILADTWHWILLSVAVGSVARALVGPSFDAFIAEHSSESNRGKVYGVSQAIFMIVMVVGPPVGAWLAGSYGFKFMLLIAGIFYFIAALMRIGMAREAAKGQTSKPTLSFASLKSNLGAMFGLMFSGGLITWILITDGFRDVSFQLSGNLFPVYMQEFGRLSIQQIGWVNSLFGLCMMLTTIPGGWLSDKVGERVGIASGMILMAGALLLLINIPQGNSTLYFVGWGMAGVGVGLMSPAYQSLISKAVPQHLRGTAFGLFSTSLGVISLPAPWIGAQLWDRFSPQFPFTITAIALLLSVIPIWIKFKLPKNIEQEKVEEALNEDSAVIPA